MKHLLLFSILLLGFSLLSSAQSFDMQWYALQNNGLAGNQLIPPNSLNPNTPNNRPAIWSNSIQPNLAVHGIYAPHTQIDSRAEDDLFIIYNSGAYYSSRYNNSSLAYGPLTPSGSRSLSFIASNLDDHQISYLYFTNKYDIDDPPEKIQANNNITENLNALLLNNFSEDLEKMYNSDGENQNTYILSNHDVIPRKDVTLIIHSKNLSGTYTLWYNKLIHSKHVDPSGIVDPINWRDTIPNPAIFNESNVFEGNRFIIPQVSHQPSSGKTTFFLQHAHQTDHLFVNLRGTEMLEKYLPTTRDSFHVVYELADSNGTVIARHTDPNRPTHDPNEVVLIDVCDSCRTAYYKGYFHNETPNPVGGLAFTFKFPQSIIGASYKIVELKVNGNTTTALRESMTNNKLFVKLADSLSIRSSRSSNNPSFGKVEFSICVNFHQEVSLESMRNSTLLTSEGLTYFNHGSSNLQKTYELHARDKTKFYLDDNTFDRILNQDCQACHVICKAAKPACLWYNCFDFWLIDYRWLFAIIGFGIIACLYYYLTKKD